MDRRDAISGDADVELLIGICRRIKNRAAG
jgi:hypothetical protein